MLSSILTVLFVISLAATLIVMLMGVVAMSFGPSFHDRHGNNLMRLRVVLQGVAVLLFAGLMLIRFGGS